MGTNKWLNMTEQHHWKCTLFNKCYKSIKKTNKKLQLEYYYRVDWTRQLKDYKNVFHAYTLFCIFGHRVYISLF